MKTLPILIILLLLLGGAYTLFDRLYLVDKNVNSSGSSEEQAVDVVEDASTQEVISNGLKTPNSPILSSADVTALKSIREEYELGWVGWEDRRGYSGYDDETLLELIDQDDRIAALQYIENGGHYRELCPRVEVALRTGLAGPAISHLYGCVRRELAFAKVQGLKDEALIREYKLKILSVIEFATLRGDYRALEFLKFRKEKFDLELSEADRSQIRSLALARLRQINSYRQERGLEPFQPVTDNAIRDFYLATVDLSDLNEWHLSMLGL